MKRVALLFCLIVLAFPSGAFAQPKGEEPKNEAPKGENPKSKEPKTVSRFVEFRDGSMLRLSVVNEKWPIKQLTERGEVKSSSLQASQVKTLILTQDESFERKRKILTAVHLLGSELFGEREDAWKTLLKMGKAVRPDLKACLQLTDDPETQARLRALLKIIPGTTSESDDVLVAFDRFITKESFWGFLEGRQPVKIILDEKTIALPRKEILRITSFDPATQPVTWQQPGALFQRISPENMPQKATKIDFEIRGKNQLRNSGTVLADDEYQDKGLMIASPKGNGMAFFQNRVGTRYSWVIGSSNPQMQADIEVRFVDPNRPHVPAGVTLFGCWLGSASPGGLKITAYDVKGAKVGVFLSEEPTAEYLGFRSRVPIHRVTFELDRSKDTNYYLDDFEFVMSSRVQAATNNKFLVRLANGTQTLCREIALQKGMCKLQGLPAGLPNLSVPFGEVLRINTPRKQAELRHPDTGIFATLADGSVLYGKETKSKFAQPEFDRESGLWKMKGEIIGLRSVRFALPKIPDDLTKQSVVNEETKAWESVSYVRPLEEVVIWKSDKGEFRSSGYRRLPPLWLGTKKVNPMKGKAHWRIQTSSTELLSVAQDSKISGELSKGLTITWRGKTIELDPDEIVSLTKWPEVRN
ncbi:MAG: hypothetical protein ACFCD0_11445 [Gemmataceae bacterium]